MTDFRELQREVGRVNEANGWREDGVLGGKSGVHQAIVELALVGTETSEAIEEIRNGKPDKYYDGNKPEGVRSELADIVIRCMDYADKRGYDLDYDIREKLEYNLERGYRHGGKKA